MGIAPPPISEIHGARVLALLGDSITTDHISPAGNFKKDSPAGAYLMERGVQPADFNSYGARRGHHDVMMRGTFANVRLKNQLVPGVEGGFTRYLPTNEQMSIFDAAMKYKADGTALVVIGGKEYGSGSSRDWAAKGTALLGVKAVIVESYERIHRSNLVGMGVVPLQFKAGDTAVTLGLTGEEVFAIDGLLQGLATNFTVSKELTVTATKSDGTTCKFQAKCSIISTAAFCRTYSGSCCAENDRLRLRKKRADEPPGLSRWDSAIKGPPGQARWLVLSLRS